MLLFTATGEINLILLSQEEVVLKVTSLSGEYDLPITKERRDSRLAAAAPSGTMSSREGEACPPDDRIPEANFSYAGAEYCGPIEQELGLESREEYRRLQDYLAYYHQSPVPVSHTSLQQFLVFSIRDQVCIMAAGQQGVYRVGEVVTSGQ